MDIAALSIGLNQMKLQQEVSMSVMKMAMDKGTSQVADLTKMLDANTKMMEQSVNPYVGANLDIKL
ncbi:MAG: YjfB family protein [Clostridiaceae bacterium]|nr:YjfB family protein [Clostridiaceae bacterium]